MSNDPTSSGTSDRTHSLLELYMVQVLFFTKNLYDYSFLYLKSSVLLVNKKVCCKLLYMVNESFIASILCVFCLPFWCFDHTCIL